MEIQELLQIATTYSSLVKDTLGKMGWPEKQVSMLRDREDFDNLDTHNLVSQLQDNIVKVETTGFRFFFPW